MEDRGDKNEEKYKKSETQGLRPVFLKKTVGVCIHDRDFLVNNKCLVSNTPKQVSLKFKNYVA